MIGSRLTSLREDAGIQQKDLAEFLNVTQSSISAYERNISEPPDEIKIKIAQYFDISLDFLIGVTDTKIALNRDDVIYLPKHFPKKYKEKLEDYMNILYENFTLKKKKK